LDEVLSGSFVGDDFAGRPSAPKAEVTSGEGEEAKVSANKVTANTHSKTAQKILAAQKQPAAQTLFMGNLPFETKEDDIRQMVEGHGLPSELEQQAKQDGAAKNPGGKPQRWLKKIRMGTFEDSGLCKG
jgi:RNA recognition motif-containing protein